MAAVGHNAKELTEVERQSLLGYLVRQHCEAEGLRAKAKAKDDETFKRGKEWGFPKEEITFFVKARKAGEGSSLVQKHSLHKKILIKIGLIPDDRGGDLLTDRADRLQLIYARGEADGLVGEGGAGSSGYSAGSDEDGTYMDGWKSGQMKYAENWQRAMEKKIAQRTKEELPPTGDDPFSDGD